MHQIKNNTICLCAIVKDESHVIKRMIDSCRDIIDYWVIVDTGSKDDTKDIITRELEGIPGELLDSTWVNFGVNRTQLVEAAKGKADYLLLLDADMVLSISEYFDKSLFSHNAYYVKYQGDIDFAQLLFVKSSLSWHYIGVTHEHISAKGVGKTPVTNQFTIIHHADGGHRPEKLTRDITLLTKAIEDNPNESRNYFYLAQSYANLGNWEKAIELYTKRVERGGWEEEVFYSLFQIGSLHYQLGHEGEAIQQFLLAYNYRPTRFEPLYMLGSIYRLQKKYHLAIMFLEKLQSLPYPRKDLLFVHKIFYDYLADFELGISYYWVGEFEKAVTHCTKVKNHPDVPKYILKQNEDNMKFSTDKLERRTSGKNDIIYCSFFTVNTSYEKEIQKLQNGLNKFGLNHELFGMESLGSWVKNTQMKPSVIKAAMLKYERDVVYLDADAVLMQNPVFFDTVDADLSYYKIHEWNEILTGTMFFKNTPEVIELLDKWIQLNSENDNPDAKNFQILMESPENNLKVEKLPADYIKIFDNKLIVSEDPVIVHNQASRRFKSEDTVKKNMKNLRGSRSRCAVIGNGPFHDNFDKIIDSSDTFVMRCNDFRSCVGLGMKIDLNISSLHKDIIPIAKVDYPIFGILPISNTLYQEYTDAKQMHIHWANNGQGLIDKGMKCLMYSDKDTFTEVFSIVCQEIKAFPSVGILAIAMARWMGFKEIIVTGFTFFQSEKSHYWTDKVTVPSSHHNTEAERKLLKKWVEGDDIEYVLDEITKEKLQADARIKSNTAE